MDSGFSALRPSPRNDGGVNPTCRVKPGQDGAEKGTDISEDSYVIAPPPRPAIAVAGTEKTFPVRRIWCVGRNYEEHAREMGHDVRDPPFFFSKPAEAT